MITRSEVSQAADIVNSAESTFPYECAILQYAQDRASGEALNFGVVIYVPGLRHLAAKISPFVKRLSAAFSHFDGSHYSQVVRGFERGIEAWQLQQREPEHGLFLDLRPDAPPQLDPILRHIWPDMGGCYYAGRIVPGIVEFSLRDLKAEIEDLYDRYVDSQYDDDRRPNREDSDVWNVYSNALTRESFGVTAYLRPVEVQVGDFDLSLKHTYRNEALHILRPVSLDYANKAGIRNRVKDLLGEAQLLSQSNIKISKMYLLLGRPSDPRIEQAYISAKDALNGLMVHHEIFEEEEAQDFARQVVKHMRQHGVLPESSEDDASQSVDTIK